MIEVCKILKKENIHIAVDTAGVGNGNYQEILKWVDLVLLDIIKNNITFEFPMTGGYSASIYVKCFQDEDFRKLYSGGKFLGIDFIASEFKGYQIFYQ